MDNRVLQRIIIQKVNPTQYQKWLQYAIILGVLMVSAFIATRPTSRLTLLILAVFFGAIASIVLLRKMVLGIVGFIVACFLIPNFLGSGGVSSTLSPPVLLLGLTFVLWISNMLLKQRKLDFVPSRNNLPAVVFIAVAFVALLNGGVRYYTFTESAPFDAQIGGLAVFLVSIAAFWVGANLITDAKWLNILCWLYIGIGTLYMFGRVLPTAGPYILSLFQYGADVSVFWIWLVAIASSQLINNHTLRPVWRLFLLFLICLTFYVSFRIAYDWKSGWLPSGIALAVVLWFSSKRLQPFVILGSIGLLAVVLLSNSSFFTGGEDFSILTRDAAWKIVIEIAKINPILGIGFSNYYWYTPFFPILGIYGVIFSSHNNYIDIFAQMGIVGLICFLWFFAEIGFFTLNLRSKVPDGFPKAYVIGALGGIAGMLVTGMLGDWVLPFVYNVGTFGLRSSLPGWVFMGGIVALGHIYLNQGSTDQPD